MREMVVCGALLIVGIVLGFWTNENLPRIHQETGAPGSIMRLPLDVPCQALGPPIETPYKLFLQTVMYERQKEKVIRTIWVRDERQIPSKRFVIKKSDDPMDMGIKILALESADKQ